MYWYWLQNSPSFLHFSFALYYPTDNVSISDALDNLLAVSTMTPSAPSYISSASIIYSFFSCSTSRRWLKFALHIHNETASSCNNCTHWAEKVHRTLMTASLRQHRARGKFDRDYLQHAFYDIFSLPSYACAFNRYFRLVSCRATIKHLRSDASIYLREQLLKMNRTTFISLLPRTCALNHDWVLKIRMLL